MANSRSAPNAPLSHADEAEHRRLIAAKANAIGYEEGEFTPTFTFATPGDLSVSYAEQIGKFWRVGALLFFQFDLQITPTFTTASGHATIGGLPYASSSVGFDSIAAAQIAATSITWPTGRTAVSAYIPAGTATAKLFFDGSGVTTSVLTASDITSGVAITLLRAQGFYPVQLNAG